MSYIGFNKSTCAKIIMMATSKSNQLISEQINDILKPQPLAEENDDIEAKIDDFDEFRGEFKNRNFITSEIRRQNTKQLNEVDSKYKGKVVSRKELSQEDGDISVESEEMSSDSESLDDDSESQEDEDNYGDLSQFITNKSSQANKNEKEEALLIKKGRQDNDVEIKKGLCVQNQLKVWENLLEVRIKAQKMLITANSLPDYDSFLDLSDIDDNESKFLEKTEGVCDNIYALVDNLLDLQTVLVENFSETKKLFAGIKRKKPEEEESSIFKRSRLAEYADKIEDNYSAYTGFRNQTLQKWHDRTKNLKDSRNSAMDLSIVNKIENALLGKHEMIRKTQIYRGDFDIFGASTASPSTSELTLPEIYDDSDFYHQLLRELIEYKSNIGDNQTEITQKFIELQKVRSKMKRKVEVRASKGRKIRYNVHNKLVNFMPPRDDSVLTDEAKTELFNSLFGNFNNN